MKPAATSRTVFDKVANVSFFLTAPPVIVAFLGHADRWSMDMQAVFVFNGMICELVGFILGVVSLFGRRMKSKSFPLALFGTFIGGISGCLFLFGFLGGRAGFGG
ncbi:MAG: hypothetical protein ABSE48_12610 [Verrucomicrobiota bacterium]|jgi:hypothetical protein